MSNPVARPTQAGTHAPKVPTLESLNVAWEQASLLQKLTAVQRGKFPFTVGTMTFWLSWSLDKTYDIYVLNPGTRCCQADYYYSHDAFGLFSDKHCRGCGSTVATLGLHLLNDWDGVAEEAFYSDWQHWDALWPLILGSEVIGLAEEWARQRRARQWANIGSLLPLRSTDGTPCSETPTFDGTYPFSVPGQLGGYPVNPWDKRAAKVSTSLWESAISLRWWNLGYWSSWD